MYKTLLSLSVCLVCSTQAALIAHYDFSDNDLTDNEVGASYTLAEVNNGTGDVTLNPDGSAHFPGNDTTNSAYLEVAGPGGAANFTVSLWVKADTWNQGSFQGIFSNNSGGASTDFSWQIDASGDSLRVVTKDAGVIFTTPTNTLDTASWYNIVFIKNGSNAELYFTEEGAGSANHVGTVATNPGGLQFFRLGTNRNTDSLFEMDMANVKIYNSVEDVNSLLAEGSMTIPEPSGTALLGLAGLTLLLRRR